MDFADEDEFGTFEDQRRGGRGRYGPTHVTFSVFVYPEPSAGQSVYLEGTIPELNRGVQMHPNATGGGKLWNVTINVANPSAVLGSVAASASSGIMAMMGMRGGMGGGSGEPPLFEYTYSLRDAAGNVVKAEDGPRNGEYHELKDFYYHRAKWAETAKDEGFKLFVHDEIDQLQRGTTDSKTFQKRMGRLSEANFQKKRTLLDKAVEELIGHWGMDTPAPAQTVLAVATAIGCMKKERHALMQGMMGLEFSGMHDDFESSSYGFTGGRDRGADKEKEKEDPPSLMVARWVVRHCPSRAELEEQERAAGAGGERGEPRMRRGATQAAEAGVRFCAENLYKEEHTFEWLKLLNFLHEHGLPQPVSASTCKNPADEKKLANSFIEARDNIFRNFSEMTAAARSITEEKERAKAESDVKETIHKFLRGLCTFCPSINCMRKLVAAVTSEFPSEIDILGQCVWQRIKSLQFGQNDKEQLKAMISEIPFMQADDTAIALLQSQHHPSEAFKDVEIVDFIKQVTQNSREVRPATPNLQAAARRWLTRLCRHAARHAEPVQGDRSAGADIGQPEYQAIKRENMEAMCKGIQSWHMVLEVPCFKIEEEAVRSFLFEFSQMPFFKEQEPILVLDCILELEGEKFGVKESLDPSSQLMREIVRITIKSVREAQDQSGRAEMDETVLQLLFQKPSMLRYPVIHNLITILRQATGSGRPDDLREAERILANAEIWERLLSAQWLRASGIGNSQLGPEQKKGKDKLISLGGDIEKVKIPLAEMHSVVKYQDVYEQLVGLVATKPTNINDCKAKLQKFDTERDHLQNYIKQFCQLPCIDAQELEVKISKIQQNYHRMQLSEAVAAFDGLLVRPHLDKLYQLRSSDVFSGIWEETAMPEGTSAKTIKQDEVVSSLIPKAIDKWEKLSASIEDGTATLKSIKWAVDFMWPKVKSELETLSKTAPKKSNWVPKAEELCQSMRLASKLRTWAPKMLFLRDVLKDLFKGDKGADECVLELQKVCREYEHMWTFELQQMTDVVKPFRATITTLSPSMQDYSIQMASHDESVTFLLQQQSTDDFNRLISLSTPNTDDPIILNAIASLRQMRTFLADVLFTKPPYAGLRAFIEALATLKSEENDQYSTLMAVQQSFDPVQDLLTKNSRTPGVQACYDLKKISLTGTFHVTCALKEASQLKCKAQEQTFDYEALAELRRQLLMAGVPEELEGTKGLPAMLEALVEKLQLLEDYGRCTMELYQLGHFAFRLNQEVLTVSATDDVKSVESKLHALQTQLDGWQKAVEAARGQHYFLNYFTVRELCFLMDNLPNVEQDEAWQKTWPLLRVVDLTADLAATKTKVVAMLKDQYQVLKTDTKNQEVPLLNAMGELLGKLFHGAEPQVRKLEGLIQAKQHLVGDLVIRSMQNKEEGTPLFLCCADNPSEVTELVLSIYTRRERVPEAEELLLCSSHTTLEEIELLLRRFFKARQQGREDRLYCVGNVHLLSYVTQCGTVEALRRMEEEYGYGDASALVFVSGMQNQMLTNALSRHSLSVRPLPRDLLKSAISMVGEKYHGRQMSCVFANCNGVGKTHHIYREIHKLQSEHDNKPMLHHVEVRETTNISSLVSALLKDPTDTNIPTAVHIDLAHILPDHIDTLMFELLIVGVLRDPQKSQVYVRAKKDIFFVEIPNTPGETTANGLPFCLDLPMTYKTMSKEAIDDKTPVITFPEGGARGAPFISFEDNVRMKLVGKTLAAMKVEAFNPKSPKFDVQWTGKKAADIDKTATYELLEEICSSDTSPPSFLVFTNLVNFLGHLIESAEGWNMMNLQLLQNFDPGLKNFKHCFFRLLIETSRDFALRQVPKKMGDLGAELLGDRRPQSANQLLRSLSRTMSGGAGGGPVPELIRSVSQSKPALVRKNSPTLMRQTSRLQEEQAAADQADAQAESSGVGRIATSSYVSRFDQMPSWESCVHPVANFKKNERGIVIGCNIMSLQRDFIGNFIDRNLQNSLNLNDLKLDRDWTKVTHSDAVHLVHQIEGGELLKKKDHEDGPKEYVVTVDNLIKLMSIQQRLKYGLPVIVMGETGCGKTALVNFLSKTLDFHLFTLDIHGGITDQTIMDFLDGAITQSDSDNKGVLVFFDEINAANCMALFKTIIIDRMYGNKRIPARVRVISCCNPYRVRNNKELEDVALVFSGSGTEGASGITDPMKSLVYRVHPLPESLIDVVSDFGSLSEKSEEIYINAILRKELPPVPDPNAPPPPAPAAAGAPAAAAAAAAAPPLEPTDYDHFVSALNTLLCKSQSFVRDVNNGEKSVVSMRDIGRAAKVFKWFLTYYAKLKGVLSPMQEVNVEGKSDPIMVLNVEEGYRAHIRSSVILTLGYCYHARLPRQERWGYRKRVCEVWESSKDKNPAMAWLQLDKEADVNDLLTSTQYDFVSQMELGEGIALNEALRENLFMLLVSVMNHIPILLIGKPGCSKSLAMGVLQNNLNGNVSKVDFFKAMPALDVFAYQCSPLSTPDAILSAFNQARNSNLSNTSTIVCVLLDEVGLAEESPHLPLKVLHKELQDLRGIACVGISNWTLDAAKMNRCVTLYRPAPTTKDLQTTAEGMVQSEHLKAYLKAMSEAFSETYKAQKRADFWGMREFYSTVRVINSELKLRAEQGLEAVLEPRVLMKTIQRNFGGQPPETTEGIIEEFFDRCGLVPDNVEKYTIPQLIQQNLEESDARHLMLLTKNNAALRLLYESGLVDHSGAEVLFGSVFPSDMSDLFVAMNLQRIKSYMQRPICLIMVHCDSLYESLYDLLNQHYMEYGGTRYVRIAHGSKAKMCPIHRKFRVIVVTEISDAYFRLAPPLLNRFEKQIFTRKDLMSPKISGLLSRVNDFWRKLNEMMNDTAQEEAEDAMTEEAGRLEGKAAASVKRPAAGYHPELLASLVFTVCKRNPEKSDAELFDACKKTLTWILTPEAVCIAAAKQNPAEMRSRYGFSLVEEYFSKQSHSDLPSFSKMLTNSKEFWCDDYGAQSLVLTYGPVRGKVGSELSSLPGYASHHELSLYELSSSTDIEKAVKDFYAKPSAEGDNHFLIIHADPVAASVRMIEHCRFECEKWRAAFVKERDGAPAGSMYVILVVHLNRGLESKFSFDFDSQWFSVFLDSVEASQDMNSMPSLGSMLNMPLIQVIEGLDFKQLMKSCFRSSLSRLTYPHARRPDDLHAQINLFLGYIEDKEFVDMTRDWILNVLKQTPKNHRNPEEGSFGDDRHWFASIASDAAELALAGTFRAALHSKIVVLIGSLISALVAHLDRNGGLELLVPPNKRDFWLKLYTASLTSPHSTRLQADAVSALKEDITAQHEVGTDAQTAARPYQSTFPASWFISKSLDELRSIINQLTRDDQLASFQSQFQMTKLAEIGINPVLEATLLDNYIADFTAMHVDWTDRLDRNIQHKILRKTLERSFGKKLSSILEVHLLFWDLERKVGFTVNLLNAAPQAVESACKLIDEANIDTYCHDILLLVHETLARELEEKPSTSALSHYRDWLMRKHVIAGLTSNLMGDKTITQPVEQVKKLTSNTEPRMETLALCLQHVAYPLDLDPQLVATFAADLPNDKIRHSGTMLAMLKFCQETMNKYSSQKEQVLKAFSSFMESWILDVCLRNAEAANDLEPASLRLVCDIAVGLPLKLQPSKLQGIGAGDLAEWTERQEAGNLNPIAILSDTLKVPRSMCLNLALLRKLIVHSDGKAKEDATKYIHQRLQDVAKTEGHSDTSLNTRYAILCEEVEEVKGGLNSENPESWPDLNLEDVFGDKSDLASMLKKVSVCRRMLQRYAEICVQDRVDKQLHDRALPKVNGLLKTNNTKLERVCRTMRLYLLKCMERVRGVSFVRNILDDDNLPVKETDWNQKWRELNDMDYEKFIGARLVPRWNPFRHHSQECGQAQEAVMSLMTTNNTTQLQNYTKDLDKVGKDQRGKLVAALLLALCQEPGLLMALQKLSGTEPPAWRQTLSTWLKSGLTGVTEKERALLRVFAADETFFEEVPEEGRKFLGMFKVSADMDEILKFRVLAHICASMMSASESSLLYTFKLLMLESGSLMDGSPAFLPAMDEDIRNRVLKALVERGENIWKFKSHWYKCTCGYSFFIGECGRPMEVSKCPACGAGIGGTDHNKTRNTTEDDETDRSPWGYGFPVAEKDEKHVAFREVQSSSARAIRLLLHGSMVLGVVANAKAGQKVYNHLINPESMCTMKQESEASYLGAHFHNDWKGMVEALSSNTEDLAMGMHNLLIKMCESDKDAPSVSGHDGKWGVLDLAKRNDWEMVMEKKYLKDYIKNMDNLLQDLLKAWGGDGEDGNLVAQIKEAADVNDYVADKREHEMPQLWAFRQTVTREALDNRIGLESNAKEQLPVLLMVLETKLNAILGGLRLLTGVFEWQSLCLNRFSGRITKEAAEQQVTIGDVLDSGSEQEQARWRNAFAHFQRAWNMAMPHCEYECLVIAESMRQHKISRDDYLAMAIPDRDAQGVGMYALAVLTWTVAQHNELVQVAAQAVGYPARKVSSRLLSQHDVIKYKMSDLLMYLRSRCATWGAGGKLNLDLKQVELQLRREMAHPEITIEMGEFQWIGQSFTAGHDLSTAIPQKDLLPDTIERLKNELQSPAVANMCLQKVQMSISFILKAGSSLSKDHAGETRLSDYMQRVLSEPMESLPSATARADVRLFHVDSFVKVLKSVINKDPMDTIDVKYKAPLPKELETLVKGFAKDLPEGVVEMMGDFAEKGLSTGSIGEKETIVPTLEPVREMLECSDEAWDAVKKHFTDEMKLKHWASIYKILSQTSK
eukprot:TRINITY_DN1271_c1_g1_i1.p1 TRINITY_DN1271_c1_g1~~TRINITY_DN1271_c1_g1_i1.p1  ORF type:complete len:4782 (+),score=1057.93 TRINITY_DN1271_c1_g1_i1:65-14410(+)